MDVAEVCPNIGPHERAVRNRWGVGGTIATLLLVSALIETHAGWPWRLLVALPAYVGAIGFLQARAQTCVAFARAGIRVLGDNRRDPERVADELMKKQIAAQARRVYVQTTLVVAALMVVVLAIP